MPINLSATGVPTPGVDLASGSIYVVELTMAVPSSNEQNYGVPLILTAQTTWSSGATYGYPCDLQMIEAIDSAGAVKFIRPEPPNWSATITLGQPITAGIPGVYMQLERPANGNSFKFRFTFQVRSTTYGPICPFKAVLTQANGTAIDSYTAGEIYVIQPQGSVGTPNAPTGLAVTDTDVTFLTIEWTDTNTGELGTTVFISTDGSSFTVAGSVGPSTTSYTAVGLDPSTTYYFKVAAFNKRGLSAFSSTVSDATEAPPPAPTVLVTTLTAEAVKATQIDLAWDSDAPADDPETEENEHIDDEDGWAIQRATVTGGPYDIVARVPAGTFSYSDKSVQPLTEYFYVVTPFNDGGLGTDSAEASAETPEQIITVATDLGFTFTPGARTKIIQAAGRVMFWSDMDRPVIRINRRTYKMGLKPQLAAPGLASAGSGDLTGKFIAYTMLLRSDGLTPSMPSPASADVTITDGRLTITPQLNDANTKVKVRDIGYDTDGTEIDGCDFYEVYLWDVNGARGIPVWVATLPITTTTYTTDVELTVTDLASPSRKEMAIDFQNLLPPACGIAEFDPATSRVRAFGERPMRPSDEDTANGAQLSITNGAHTCTVTGWTNVDLDALYHKELYLNKKATHWFVVDVDGTTLTIRNPDGDKDEKGFEGDTDDYPDFSFAAPSRVYMSAFFTNSLVSTAFQPETFPPRYLEAQLNPDDNQDPNGAISSRDVMFLTKPGSCFFTTGGAATDEDDESGDNLPAVVNVSRGSGLLAPKTLCRDRFDVVYGLNDQGPFSLRQNGVQKEGTMAGVAWLLQDYYEVGSAAGAVGSWFTREDYLLVCGINRKQAIGAKHWFIFDSRNKCVLPQTFPTRITALEQSHTDSGDNQMLYGDETGAVGVLLVQGIHVDSTNYSTSDPTSYEVPIDVQVTTGVVAPTYAFTPDLIRPHIKVDGQTETLVCTIAYDTRNRSGDPAVFTPVKSRTFSIRVGSNPDNVPLPRKACQSAKFRLSFTAPRDNMVRVPPMEIEAVEGGRG